MNKAIKTLALALTTTAALYVPNTLASSTKMLLTIAENEPVVLEQLTELKQTDNALLQQLLVMAESNPEQLKRLLNLKATNPAEFEQLIVLWADKSDSDDYSTNGTISDGTVIRN